MDPVLAEIYALVVPSLPFVIGAYALLWVSLVVYVGMTYRRVGRIEKEMGVLEEALERRSTGA
ncbi:MAG: hypothetical protein RBS78_04620 [Coriobacteriia bacterium]|jgi:hypothetical protein|nr:hypothetical protein [Coriobacteriia bacterium]